MEQDMIIGVDMGGTHTRIAVMNTDKSVITTQKHKTEEIFINHHDAIDAIHNFLQPYLVQYTQIQAAMIAFPAALDKTRQYILSCPNISQLAHEQRNIATALKDSLKIPVFLERDVHMQLYFDLAHHDITHQQNIGFYIGTGFGQAIWLKDFHLGAHGVASELGHIPFNPKESSCGCGLQHCLESICSGKWLFQWYQEKKLSLPIDYIWQEYEQHEELHQFVDYAARAIATSVNIIDPDNIILGGGVIDMCDFPKEALVAQIMRYVRTPLPAQELEIYFASSSSSNGAIGACLYGYDRMNKGDINGNI